ncbi:hypothetical protein Bcen2424_0218 [Burkholderia cenocepacia HI2424]|nr:hypothetical protein Bcen2424_0218 [Burkholderia cenocepacia HI2424]
MPQNGLYPRFVGFELRHALYDGLEGCSQKLTRPLRQQEYRVRGDSVVGQQHAQTILVESSKHKRRTTQPVNVLLQLRSRQ